LLESERCNEEQRSVSDEFGITKISVYVYISVVASLLTKDFYLLCGFPDGHFLLEMARSYPHYLPTGQAFTGPESIPVRSHPW